MAAGQLVLALATTLPLAVAARVLIGTGDALTFISVLSVVTAWFPPRRVPVMTQLTGLVGQLGQVLSAVPLAALLHGPGWTPAFLCAAGAGGVRRRSRCSWWCATGRRAPRRRPGRVAAGGAARAADVVVRAGHPARALDALGHAVLRHGVRPALGRAVPGGGAGDDRRAGECLLTLLVVVGIIAGPLFGEFAARHPMRRSYLVLTVIGAHALVWAAVLLVAPPAPRWLLVVLVIVIGTGGPGSMIGFDYARTFNPRSRQGAAVGIVNVGGFVASLLVAWAIGVVLGRAGGYTPEAFRVAWTVQYVVWAFAVVAVLVARRLGAAQVGGEGVVVLPLRAPLAERRSRRRP